MNHVMVWTPGDILVVFLLFLLVGTIATTVIIKKVKGIFK